MPQLRLQMTETHRVRRLLKNIILHEDACQSLGDGGRKNPVMLA